MVVSSNGEVLAGVAETSALTVAEVDEEALGLAADGMRKDGTL